LQANDLLDPSRKLQQTMTQGPPVHSVRQTISRRLPGLRRIVANLTVDPEALAKRVDDLSRELSITRAELIASNKRVEAANERRAGISRELSIVKAELVTSADREAGISRELLIAKAELVASSDREADISRELSVAKAELAAAKDRAARGERSVGERLENRFIAYNSLLDDLTATKAKLAAAIGREINTSRELLIAKAELAAAIDRAGGEKAELIAVASLRDQLTAHSNLLLRHFADAQGHFTEAQNEYRRQIPMMTANIAALRSGQEDEFRSVRKLIIAPGAHAGTMAFDLYLDLLEASLTGTLYADASQSPWAKDVYDPARRTVGRDWPAQAETMIGTARMRNLRTLTQRALDENIPGDLIETGVWRGGACIYMRGILAAAGDRRRRVFVADSFCGLPPPDEAAYPADAGDPHHTFPQLAISREAVEANFRRYGLMDEQVVFLEGWFKDTLPTAPIDQLAVLRLDGDMYESTMDALNALYAKVSPGGFVIVDDYVLKACAAAVEDFRGRQGISAPLHEVDGAAVWWQVPG
jgi:O-methyltransferase